MAGVVSENGRGGLGLPLPTLLLVKLTKAFQGDKIKHLPNKLATPRPPKLDFGSHVAFTKVSPINSQSIYDTHKPSAFDTFVNLKEPNQPDFSNRFHSRASPDLPRPHSFYSQTYKSRFQEIVRSPKPTIGKWVIC